MRGARLIPTGGGGEPSARETLVATDPASLVIEPEAADEPVLQVVLSRARAGSRPGARSDPHQVHLVIEGGGMRGSVSGGMCVVLEAAALVPAFDRIYGVSAARW